ncbi:hypothetical protein SLA2020_417940 [Shorea laevis]
MMQGLQGAATSTPSNPAITNVGGGATTLGPWESSCTTGLRGWSHHPNCRDTDLWVWSMDKYQLCRPAHLVGRLKNYN